MEKSIDQFVQISISKLEELMLQVSSLKQENEKIKKEISILKWRLHEQD